MEDQLASNPGKPNTIIVKLYFREYGQGDPIVILHGLFGSSDNWLTQAKLFSEKYRVLTVDLRNHGLSPHDREFDYRTMVGDLEEFFTDHQLTNATLIGHSMGGMLATRFALMYPQTVEKLVYENPIGLEDYKTFVPYQSTDVQYSNELKATFESLEKYQQSYYPVWKGEYEQYVTAQHEALQTPNFQQATWVSALTYQMIYEQPVLYEFKNVAAPALIIIGQEDRTVVGKNLLSKEAAAKHGAYPQLGRWLKGQIKNSKLVEPPGVGHIPHVQSLQDFKKEVLSFLK